MRSDFFGMLSYRSLLKPNTGRVWCRSRDVASIEPIDFSES